MVFRQTGEQEANNGGIRNDARYLRKNPKIPGRPGHIFQKTGTVIGINIDDTILYNRITKRRSIYGKVSSLGMTADSNGVRKNRSDFLQILNSQLLTGSLCDIA